MNKIFDNIHIIIPYAWVPRLTESTTFLQVQSVFTHVASIYANLKEQQKGVYIRKEFNSLRISLEHQHGRRHVKTLYSILIKKTLFSSIDFHFNDY